MASIGEVVGTITARDNFTGTLRLAKRELGSFSTGLARGVKTIAKAGAAIGAVISGVGIASIKAASDFESSFAGVRKTVDATEGEFAQLSEGMRDMAREIPVGVNQLNAIGEAAGQLGIETQNILEFTETMAQLGVTTNLSAEEAATSLARLANIMRTPQDQFDELGSTIVELGNNFATTEAEIVNFGTRMAGAAEVAGLAETDVLAIGAAMSSVGVEAERGGTAVQKVLLKMVEAVEGGGDSLKAFAATAGLSADQFADAFRDDAAGAFRAFVEGLGAQGTAATQTLQELELTDQRLTSAFLSLAGAGDLLADSLDTANRAFEDNTALSKEAEQRFNTFASQMTLLKNAANDVLIQIGKRLLPVMRELVVQVRNYVNTHGPALAQSFSVVLAGALDIGASALSLFGSAVATVVEKLIGLRTFVASVNLEFQKLQRDGIAASIRSLEGGIEQYEKFGTMDVFGGQFESIEEVREEIERLRGELEDASSDVQDAGKSLAEWRETWDNAGDSTEKFREILERAREFMERTAESIRNGGDAADVFADSAQDMTDAMSGTVTKALHPFESVIRSVGDGITTTEDRMASLDPGLQRLVEGFDFASESTRAMTIMLLNSTNPALRQAAIDSLIAGEAVEEVGDKAKNAIPALGSLGESLTSIGRGMGFIGDEGGFDFFGGLENLGKGAIDQLGSMLTGGISSAISAGMNALIGLVADAFGSDAADFASKFKSELEGIGAVSDGLAEQMGEMANALKDQGRELPHVVAKWAHLDEAIQETGVSGDNFTAVMGQVAEGLAHLEHGTITEAEAVETLEGVIPDLIGALDDVGAAGTDAFRQMIEDTRAAGLEIEQLDQHIRSAASGIGEGVRTMIDAGIQGAGQAQFAASSIVTAFQELVAQGVPAADAFDMLGSEIADLQARADELGVKLPAPFTELSEVMDVLADDKIAKTQQRIDGMGQTMRSLLELGIKPTAAQFTTFQNNATSAFNQLQNQGLTARQSFMAMSDDMKLLARLQNDFGIELDDATKKIFEQAGATDMLESEGVTATDVFADGLGHVVDRLDRVVLALGGTLEGLGQFGDTAQEETGFVSDRFKELREKALSELDQIGAGGEDAFGFVSDSARHAVDDALKHFSRMQDELVGNSIVPDMVSDMGDEWGRMEEDFGDSTVRMTGDAERFAGHSVSGVQRSRGGRGGGSGEMILRFESRPGSRRRAEDLVYELWEGGRARAETL